jgi:hypothetical protein
MHHHTSLLYTADVDRITTLDCATLRLHVCSLRVWALRFNSCCLESRFNHHCVFEGRKDLPFTIFHKGLANSYAQSSDASPKPSFGQNHTKNFTRRLPHAEGCFMTTTILMTSHFCLPHFVSLADTVSLIKSMACERTEDTLLHCERQHLHTNSGRRRLTEFVAQRCTLLAAEKTSATKIVQMYATAPNETIW